MMQRMPPVPANAAGQRARPRVPQAGVEKEATSREAFHAAGQDDGSWVEWVPFIGDLYGGSLNAGEGFAVKADQEARRRDAQIEKTVAEIIHGIEEDQQRSLGPDDVAEVREQVLAIRFGGLEHDAEEDPQEDPRETETP